jgi:hypothetical protein
MLLIVHIDGKKVLYWRFLTQEKRDRKIWNLRFFWASKESSKIIGKASSSYPHTVAAMIEDAVLLLTARLPARAVSNLMAPLSLKTQHWMLYFGEIPIY